MPDIDAVFTEKFTNMIAEISIRHGANPPQDPARLPLWVVDLLNRENARIEEALENIDDN